MSSIGESLAELGQGAVVAAAVEPSGGEPGRASEGATHEARCLNCGTGLIGTHCHVCGQSAHVHRTLGAFAHDLLHGVFHFEGRIWRTLPLLLWQPGRLTREYIDGRRVSYVSPIALFLFTMFLMFAVFHAVEDQADSGAAMLMTPEQREVAINDAEARLTELQAQRLALKDVSPDGDALDDVNDQIDGVRDKLENLKEARASLDQEGQGKSGGKDQTHQIEVSSDIAAIDHAVKAFRVNPDLAVYKLQTHAYKYSWALIPISVPFLWLLFPFSRRFHLYDHTVFVTYSLCFMTMLLIAGLLLKALGLTSLASLLFFVPPFHMYRQLRGTYGCSGRSAALRTLLLLGFSSTALMMFFMMIMAQSAV